MTTGTINRSNPDSTQDIYTYNDANQVTGSQTVKVDTSTGGATLTPKWSSNYTFDSDGRISGVTGTRPSGANLNESYTYNNGTEKLNRLTQATIDGNVYNYQYDPAGNMTNMSIPGGANTFTYDADNRITNSGFSYDNNGNLTNVAMYGTTYQYSFDSGNRLTTVKDAGNNVIASYTYDGDGNRLTKTVGSTTTTYHYFQGQLMYETVGTTVTAVYLRSSDGKLMGVKLNGSYYYYHYNAQGDVTAVTDSTGAVYRQYVYDPYGNIISVKDGSGNAVNIGNDPGFNNAYTYRGYRYDTETGLYFLQSRYYAAGIGRFLTKDSLLGHLTNSQSLNRYAYTYGDPVNSVDPTGNDVGSPGVDGTTGIPYDSVGNDAPQNTHYVYSEKNKLAHGWKYRQDTADERKSPDKHMHVLGPNNENYSQDENGTAHHPNSNPGDPPKKVLKELKEKSGWDWVGNKGISTTMISGTDVGLGIGGGYIIYRGVRFIPSLFPTLWPSIPFNLVAP